MSGDGLDDRAAALREAFDLSFSRAPVVRAAAAEKLLAIRIGTDRYALRLDSIAGLFAGKNISWVPSPAPELLGIAGFRGTAQPVYDLAMLLGHPRAASPRWIVIAASHAVGLAFDGFDGFVSAAPEAIGTCPIVDVASVLARITRKTARDGGN